MSPPPPPPPPPPMCIPFRSKKPKRVTTLAQSEKGSYSRSSLSGSRNSSGLSRQDTCSSNQTLNSKSGRSKKISEDTESYQVPLPVPDPKSSRKRGYGWGVGSGQHVARGMARKDSSGSSSSADSPDRGQVSRQSSYRSSVRPGIHGNDSSSTLVGSALERKINDVESVREKVDSGPRLENLRKKMAENMTADKKKTPLDYYVILSEDAHGSEYVAAPDKRRQWISGYSGTAGVAVVSKTAAYLITDSRYWAQADSQVDKNWTCIQAGHKDGPPDWISWLADRANKSKVGLDGRHISYPKCNQLATELKKTESSLVFPSQNLVDCIWNERPLRSKERIFVHPEEFAGQSTNKKLEAIRQWIKDSSCDDPSYASNPNKKPCATLISALDEIAYVLNLRGQDIPFNPVFHSYLLITLDKAILFIAEGKVGQDVEDYLKNVGVKTEKYDEIWRYLRSRELTNVIITPETSYAVGVILTRFRCTTKPSYVASMKAIKNETEVDGMRRAYIRDGVSFVRFLAWLTERLSNGYLITEYEAAFRLTELRRQNKHFMGLAYENISASGPNAALPHYSPVKSDDIAIDPQAPYLNDSGGQYKDGTCDTTRTWMFGRPTPDHCHAYTRVLQGHIAIDSAIFPEGTCGQRLDALARSKMWKDGMDFPHGTGHGVGSFLNVHEGPHGFQSDVPLVPGHVITNEPGYYVPGQYGIRIESALVVRKVKVQHGDEDGRVWLGFERLTCVPIQAKMIKPDLLTNEEKEWIKNHNKLCLEILGPRLTDDKRALEWLKRQASLKLGISRPGPGGLYIDWGE